MIRRCIIGLILYCIACTHVIAQDIYFSQFTQNALLVNPANTGEHDGSLRFHLHYKNQWQSVMTEPYTSFTFSMDRSLIKNRINSGLLLLKDQAGKGQLGFTSIHIPMATKARLSDNSYLKLSVMFGIQQFKVNGSDLLWGSQFNGKRFDPVISHQEYDVDYRSYSMDFSTGVLYVYKNPEGFNLNGGLAVFHLTKTKYVSQDRFKIVQPKRIQMHANSSIELKEKKIELLPACLFIKQGTQHIFTIGTGMKYLFGLNSRYTGKNIPSNVTFGINYRTTDAIVPYLQIDYRKQLSIGISYDIHVSTMYHATSARGGTELTLTYLLNSTKH